MFWLLMRCDRAEPEGANFDGMRIPIFGAEHLGSESAVCRFINTRLRSNFFQ